MHLLCPPIVAFLQATCATGTSPAGAAIAAGALARAVAARAAISRRRITTPPRWTRRTYVGRCTTPLVDRSGVLDRCCRADNERAGRDGKASETLASRPIPSDREPIGALLFIA